VWVRVSLGIVIAISSGIKESSDGFDFVTVVVIEGIYLYIGLENDCDCVGEGGRVSQEAHRDLNFDLAQGSYQIILT